MKGDMEFILANTALATLFPAAAFSLAMFLLFANCNNVCFLLLFLNEWLNESESNRLGRITVTAAITLVPLPKVPMLAGDHCF